ncbi:MAG: hypothetical protein Q4C37_10345 [Bacteroidales bacterium]|nr:hypothetical protein [Bacteroidales bacterium]
MMHYLSKSERIGILLVAAIALAVTIAGILLVFCGRPASHTLPPPLPYEVETLLTPDSTESDPARRDSIEKSIREYNRMRYRMRSPLDEPVMPNRHR